ncbi:MAG: fibronectin type III domain-containing protein [Saprospiraceae bacterium]
MTLKSKFSMFFMQLMVLVVLNRLSAQGNNEIVIHPQYAKSHSQIAQKVNDAQAAQIAFTNLDFMIQSKDHEAALKLFGVRKAKFYNLVENNLSLVNDQKPDALQFSVGVDEEETYELNLVQSHPVTEDFYVETSDGEKQDIKLATFYQGVVKNHEENSVVALSFFEDKVLGLISLDGQNIIFESIPNEPYSLIIYKDEDIIRNSEFSCLADQLDPVMGGYEPSKAEMTAGDCIRVYIECDNALFNNKGGTQQTVDWITAVFNNIKTLYANESVNTTLSEVYVWTTADPYSKTDSYTALTQFKTQRPTFNGDLAHLAALGGANIGGIAWIDAMCTSYKYAYSNISASYQDVPTYSWTVEVMTHEMGHNVGSNHTQWCGWPGGAIDNCYTTEGGCPKGPAPINGGTIMSYCHLTSYGINFNNGFGPLPGDKIRTRVVQVTCLGTSCSGGSCGTPTNLLITNITNTTANASWTAVTGANSYDFEYKLGTAQTWTVVNVTTNSYAMAGLTLGSLYNTRVKAKCTGGNSVYSAQVDFTTTGGSSCGTPVNLAINNITNTTANASWTAVSGANSYDFEYKANTAQTWSVVNVTTNSYAMTGLTASTLYNTRVKAKCTSGNSAYSTQVNFTTTGGTSCGTPTNFVVTNVTTNSANSSWNAVAGAKSYNFQYKLSTSQTWSQANITVTSVSLTGLTPGTSYDVRVQAVCTSGNSPFTATITFVTLTSAYCVSKGNNATFEWVAKVKIGSIDRTSGNDGGYYNGTGLIADVNRGTTYTLNYQAGSTGQSGTLYWKVWIDWNKNNSFTDAGEEVVSFATPSLALQSASITVPAGASLGNTRIRVSCKYGGYATSCQTFTYGEVEDYTLNIKAAGTLIDPNSKANNDLFEVLPNPFNHKLNINLNSLEDQEMKISISNLLGQTKDFGTVQLLKGLNLIDLDVSTLRPSTYILNLDAKNQKWHKKIIKQE